MRFLKLGVYYPKYLEEFYSRHPELTNLPYSAQHQALIDDCFGSSDFASRVLQNLGYQTCDLIANAELLQKAWADENDFKFDDANWLFEITAAQIKKFRPEVLLVADYSTITANFLRTIRRECPSTRLVLGWCGAPYTDATVFSEWDIVLSCVPEMVAAFRAQGHKSYHVNHAFAPRILEKIDLDKQPDINFSFIGSVLKANQFHLERESFVLELVRRTDLQIWSDIKNPTSEESRNIFVRRQAYQAVKAVRQAGVPEKFLTALPLVGKIARWNNPPNLNYCVDKAIRRRNHQPLFGLEMFQKLRDSRMVFNNHINISPFSASNMRLFETTGVGACLITDWKDNISELFEPEKEILTYRSVEECVEKVNHYLEHEDERQKIAAAGQRRTLSEHTFENRVNRIDEIIRQALSFT